MPDNPVRKIILILSTVPITILANCFRVLALVLGAYYFGVDRIEGLFHDVTGIALFVFALMLFFLLDRVLVVVGLFDFKTRLAARAAPEAPPEGPRANPRRIPRSACPER